MEALEIAILLGLGLISLLVLLDVVWNVKVHSYSIVWKIVKVLWYIIVSFAVIYCGTFSKLSLAGIAVDFFDANERQDTITSSRLYAALLMCVLVPYATSSIFALILFRFRESKETRPKLNSAKMFLLSVMSFGEGMMTTFIAVVAIPSFRDPLAGLIFYGYIALLLPFAIGHYGEMRRQDAEEYKKETIFGSSSGQSLLLTNRRTSRLFFAIIMVFSLVSLIFFLVFLFLYWTRPISFYQLLGLVLSAFVFWLQSAIWHKPKPKRDIEPLKPEHLTISEYFHANRYSMTWKLGIMKFFGAFVSGYVIFPSLYNNMDLLAVFASDMGGLDAWHQILGSLGLLTAVIVGMVSMKKVQWTVVPLYVVLLLTGALNYGLCWGNGTRKFAWLGLTCVSGGFDYYQYFQLVSWLLPLLVTLIVVTVASFKSKWKNSAQKMPLVSPATRRVPLEREEKLFICVPQCWCLFPDIEPFANSMRSSIIEEKERIQISLIEESQQDTEDLLADFFKDPNQVVQKVVKDPKSCTMEETSLGNAYFSTLKEKMNSPRPNMRRTRSIASRDSPDNEDYESLKILEDYYPKLGKIFAGSKEISITYLIAPMWHETESEMVTLLQSVNNISTHHNGETGPYFEVHILLDDAFETVDDGYVENIYANRLRQAIDIVLLKHNESRSSYLKHSAFYGTVYHYSIGVKSKGIHTRMQLFLHLKNGDLVLKGKRWSHVMGTYIVSLRFVTKFGNKSEEKKLLPFSVYVLLIDGDMSFNFDSVDKLTKTLVADTNCAAVCGRVRPLGGGLIASMQKFEYAAAHWLAKSFESVVGSVLCCPGCFTLVRLNYLVQVIKRRSAQIEGRLNYADTPVDAKSFLMLEMGEDRFMCTCFLKNKQTMKYCSSAVTETVAPTSYRDYLIQRKRWLPSTLTNGFELLRHSKQLVRENLSISWLFLLYVGYIQMITWISPAMVLLLIGDGLAIGFKMNIVAGLFISVGVCAVFAAFLLFYRDNIKNQVEVSRWFGALLVVLMVLAILAIVLKIISNPVSIPAMLFYVTGGMYAITSFAHGEPSILVHALIFLLLTPITYVVQLMFAFNNLNDRSWGTRAKYAHEKRKEKETHGRIYELLLWLFLDSNYPNSEKNEEEDRSKKGKTPTYSTALVDLSEISHDIDTNESCIPINHKCVIDVVSEKTSEKKWRQLEEIMTKQGDGDKLRQQEEQEEVISAGLTVMRRDWFLVLIVVTFSWIAVTLVSSTYVAYKVKLDDGYAEAISAVFSAIFLFLQVIMFGTMILGRLEAIVMNIWTTKIVEEKHMDKEIIIGVFSRDVSMESGPFGIAHTPRLFRMDRDSIDKQSDTGSRSSIRL